MGREGSEFSTRFIVLSLLAAIFFVGFVLAAHSVTTNGGFTSTSFRFNEDNATVTPYNIVNVTVNVTDNTITANITQVNITIPSSFTMVSFSNITSASVNHAFSNTSTVLSWSNFSVPLMANLSSISNKTYHTFAFNMSASTPGVFNITVTTLNATGAYVTNITAIINDTTIPSSIAYVDPTRADFLNLSQNAISVNVTGTDNGAIDKIVILLTNGSAGSTILNRSFSTSSPFFINFTGLGDGTYYVNATINDTYVGVNYTATRTIILDRTAPSVSVSCTPNPVDQDDEITCSCSSNDSTSGVASTSNTAHPSTANTGKFTTSCDVTDFAGNIGTGSFQYTVQSDGGGGGGGGGGGSGGSGGSDEDPDLSPEETATVWESTIDYNDVELESKGTVTGILAQKERVQVKISGEDHSVGVVSLTSTSAVIEVASTPQKATMNVGDVKKFEVTGDNYYDMTVTLKSITDGAAEIVIDTLHEAIVPPTQNEGTSAKNSNRTYWVIGIVILLVVAGVGIWFVKRRQ